MAQLTAFSTSVSEKIMLGFFPPSSKDSFLNCLEAMLAILLEGAKKSQIEEYLEFYNGPVILILFKPFFNCNLIVFFLLVTS